MYKELIISIVILISIFGLNYVTEKNTDNTVETLTKNLELVREDVVKEIPNKETATKHSNEAYEKWEELDDIMAFYIEHDELEKVKTALTSIRSFIQMEEYGDTVENIDKCMYLLDHIKEREKFSIDNIF